MDTILIERIRERAYQIWFASGCPQGEADAHWLTAEREILHSAKPATAAKQPVAKKANRFTRRATAKTAAAAVLN